MCETQGGGWGWGVEDLSECTFGEEEVEDISKCTFGVPLEDCFPSPNNKVSGRCVKLKVGVGG